MRVDREDVLEWFESDHSLIEFQNTRSCLLCGADEYEVVSGEVTIEVRDYSVNCPGEGCIGDTEFTVVKYDLEVRGGSRALLDVVCSRCDGADRFLLGVWSSRSVLDGGGEGRNRVYSLQFDPRPSPLLFPGGND